MATRFDPLASDAPLIVYIDYKSPYAFVAKDPTYLLGDRLGIEIDWRPLTLDIPSYLGSARLDGAGRVAESDRTPSQWTRVRYAYRDARRYAALQGHTLRGTEKIWDTRLVHVGMLRAREQGSAVLRRYTDDVYERFWRRELDVEDPGVVRGVLARAGADVDGFEAWAAGPGGAQHDEIQARILEAGIFGVPSYVVEGELFWGREHLPRILWLLRGRPGPAPDVAYRHLGEGAAP